MLGGQGYVDTWLCVVVTCVGCVDRQKSKGQCLLLDTPGLQH